MGCRFSKPNDAEAEARRAMASSRPVAAPPARQKAMEDARLKAEYEAARANGAPNDTVRDARERGRGGRARGAAARARAAGARAPRDARARDTLSLSLTRVVPPRQEENRKALWNAAKNGNTDAVRGYIAKGVNVNWKNPGNVRAPPPPRAHHGERGPSPPRPPPRGARARPGNGEFCDSRARSAGGVSATTRRSRRSRCRRNSFFAISGPRAPRRRAFRGTFAASFRRARRRACSLLPLCARARRGGEGHGMRARLQRGGTEPSVTPLSLARACPRSLSRRAGVPRCTWHLAGIPR